MKTLGQRIRELREDKDMSLRELAKEIDVSAAFLSDVELERRYPSDKHLSALAKALETSIDNLRDYDTRPPMNDLRRITNLDPKFGYAFRQIINNKVSPDELIDFVQNRPTKKKK